MTYRRVMKFKTGEFAVYGKYWDERYGWYVQMSGVTVSDRGWAVPWAFFAKTVSEDVKFSDIPVTEDWVE